MRILLLSIVFLMLNTHLQGQDRCLSSIIFTHMNDACFDKGIPQGEFDKIRMDGYPAFGYRFYQLLKFKSGVSKADTASKCRMEDFLVQSDKWCDDQYFFRELCDSTFENAQIWVNRRIAASKNGQQEYDVYRYPRVYVSNDTLWSIEINEVILPWDETYKQQVEDRMNYLRFISNDPFAPAEYDLSKAPPAIPTHWTEKAARGYFPYMLENCDACQAAHGAAGERVVNPKNPSEFYYMGHYEAFSFNPQNMEFYSLDALGDASLRQRIFEEVLEWQAMNPDIHINTFHYKPEEKRGLMFLVTEDMVVIYLGEEGEFRGHHRLHVRRYAR